jgi:secreted Zn-dependent insulinase-like peptidase
VLTRLLTHLLDNDKTGASEARRWANEIELHAYRFSRAVELAAAVAQVSKKDVQRFFDEYLARAAPQRRKLVVGIFGA